MSATFSRAVQVDRDGRLVCKEHAPPGAPFFEIPTTGPWTRYAPPCKVCGPAEGPSRLFSPEKFTAVARLLHKEGLRLPSEVAFGTFVRMDGNAEGDEMLGTDGWSFFCHPTFGPGVWGAVASMTGQHVVSREGVVTIEARHLRTIAAEVRPSEAISTVAVYELVEGPKGFLVWRSDLDLFS